MGKKILVGFGFVLIALIIICNHRNTMTGTVIGTESQVEIGLVSFKLESGNHQKLFLMTDETAITSKVDNISGDDFRKGDISYLELEVKYDSTQVKAVDEYGEEVDAYNAYEIVIKNISPEYYNVS